jgi:hypothetical protein
MALPLRTAAFAQVAVNRMLDRHLAGDRFRVSNNGEPLCYRPFSQVAFNRRRCS